MSDRFLLRQGDRVVFLGDSIRGYHRPVHQEAIRLGAPLERSRERLIRRTPRSLRLLIGAAVGANLEVGRWHQPDTECFPVRFRFGRNVLLVKITQINGQWGFGIRFRGLEAPLWVTGCPRPGNPPP
jgi:hypothetical protein